MTDSQPISHQPQNDLSTREQNEVLTGPQLFFKATLASLMLVVGMLFVTFIGVLIYWYQQLHLFLDTADITFSDLKTTVSMGLETEVKRSNGTTTVLLLGLDSLETRPGSPQLTDTMMLVSLNYKKSKVTMVSLPRDIWNQAYQTKINALYHYGKDRYPDSPEQFSTEVLTEMTGLPIEYTLVITMDQVAEIIDLLGGIEVDVPVAFTDTTFPRPDVDVTKVSDPNLLYETISFETGPQLLDSTKALQYIRSRKSGDDEGDDTARSRRQQLIIASIATKLQSKDTITNPKLMGDLFSYYQNTFSQSVPITDGIGLIAELLPQKDQLTLTTASLPIAPENPNGVITNPALSKYSAWVYEIVDQDTFRNYVQILVE